jgi:hypothetical protein
MSSEMMHMPEEGMRITVRATSGTLVVIAQEEP